MTALVEREKELARIEASLARARCRQGSVVMIGGPAGIGKTALLAAARVAGERAEMRVLRARGAELEREFGFGVARQLFEPVLAGASAAERAEWLDGSAGLAARLLALPGAPELDPQAEAEVPDPTFAVLYGLYWLCANLAASRPVCLLVDDAHWADTSSLRFLAFLGPRLEELRVSVLMATRPGEGAATGKLVAGLAAEPGTAHLEPSPLSLGAIERLVRDALGAEPDGAFVAACRQATGGVPFLLGQLLSALSQDGVAPTARSAPCIESLGARWAARWILLRLGRLSAEAVRLARALAVLESGELFDAATVAGLDQAAAAVAADDLALAGIILPARPLRFVHPVVRRGIYDELGSAVRATAHQRAARSLAASGAPQERVVEHLLAADPSGDEWTVTRLRAAARAALASGAPESATSYLKRALEEPPAPHERPGVLHELGMAEVSAGSDDAFKRLELAMELADGEPERVSAGLVLALAFANSQRFDQALEVLDRIAGWLGEEETAFSVRLETLAVGVAMLDVSASASNLARIEAARARVEADPAATREALGLATLIAAQSNEPAETVAELAERTLAAGDAALPGPADLPWFRQVAVSLVWAERHDRVLPLLDDAVTNARATGDTGSFASSLAYRAWAGLNRGDLQAAETDSRTVLESHGFHAPALYKTLNAAILIQTLVERGQLDEAERVLALVPEEAERRHSVGACLRLSRGRLRIAQRQVEDGLTDVLAAGEVAASLLQDSPGWLPWRPLAAEASLLIGDREGARSHAESGVELARAFGAPRTLGVALHAAGLVAGGSRGEDLLQEALEAHQSVGARLEVARVLTDLGAMLRRGNRRVDGREKLREALDLATRLGARPLAERAETELRATGARPRRVVLSGLESLTASERRVAELASEGLSNRAIAQALFVTSRTVEGHLTGVFRKLDLSSRDELTAQLAGA